MASLKYCNHPGCNRLVAMGITYCPEHGARARAEEEEKARSKDTFFSSYKREQYDSLYHSTGWKLLRSEQLEAHPYCSVCGNKATEVHHIKPHRGSTEVFYDRNNLTSLCHDCHFEITQQEIRDRNKARADEMRKPKVKKLWY